MSARIGTAYRITQSAAERMFRYGYTVIVASSDRGEQMTVRASSVRHCDASTSWDALVSDVDMWRNRYPCQTFYVMPE